MSVYNTPNRVALPILGVRYGYAFSSLRIIRFTKKKPQTIKINDRSIRNKSVGSERGSESI